MVLLSVTAALFGTTPCECRPKVSHGYRRIIQDLGLVKIVCSCRVIAFGRCQPWGLACYMISLFWLLWLVELQLATLGMRKVSGSPVWRFPIYVLRA